MKKLVLSALISTAVLSWPALSQGAEPEKLSQNGDWAAFVLNEGGSKICYMVSKPKEHKGNYSNRGDIFALITHRPGENARDVFSYIAGYAYKPESETIITIDSNKINLFTQGDTAWAQDTETDMKLSRLVRQGSKMVVTGTSSRGTKTTDTFSLRGATAAYKAISEACGVKP